MKVSIIPLIVRKLRKALAIVQDTNMATRNIDAGKFVMWKGELCKALSAITTGDTLSSTNLEACTDGGLNALNSKIVDFNSETLASNILSNGNKTVVNLSQYKLIGVTVQGNYSTDITNISWVPYNLFKTNPIRSDYFNGTTRRGITIKYINDTTINAAITNLETGTTGFVYGIR